MRTKIQALADKIYQEQREYYGKFFHEGEYKEELVQNASEVNVIPGKKYTKVDVGHSGKYMVDAEGNIWGVKAYGVIHHGHNYGTLDTINDWYWGDYTAVKL